MAKETQAFEFSQKEENRRHRRLVLRHTFSNPSLLFGLFVLLLLAVMVLFGPNFGKYDPYLVAQSARPYYDVQRKEMVSPPFPPSWKYPFGTDQWGNDLFSLILYGARMTVVAGVYVTLLRIGLGTLLGFLAGWTEGRLLDRAIKWISDLLSSIPTLLSSLMIIYALNIENGLWVFLVALSLVGWTETAQLVRAEVMRIRQRDFIESARAMGLTRVQIAVRHILPNVLPYILVLSALEMSAVLLLLAELGFLGTFIGGTSLYIPDVMSSRVFYLAEIPEWGGLIAQASGFIRSAPYILLAPSLAFFIAIVGLNALGEGMRSLFDRYPMSMAMLLRKRIVIFAAIFVAFSVYVVSFTGPKTSYLRVANSFEIENVHAYMDDLQEIQQVSADPAAAIDLYLEETFFDMDVARGWKPHGFVSDYHFSYQVSFASFAAEPELSFQNTADTGSFAFADDFNIYEDQALTGADVNGKLVFIRHTFINEAEVLGDYDLTGMIPIVAERSISPGFAARVAKRGAVGLLVVASPESGDLVGQESLLVPVPDDEDALSLPIFRITSDAANQLLAGEGLSTATFREAGWNIKPLKSEISMSLQLHSNQTVQTHSTLGFLGGYDTNLASELVVLFAAYDSHNQSPENFASLVTMLEIAHSWRENNLDPRRAVIFVAWDGADAGAPGASAFVNNPDNFKNLTGLASAAPRPIMVWNLGLPAFVDSDSLMIHGASNSAMTELLLNAGSLVDAPLGFAVQPIETSPPVSSLEMLSLELPGLALVADLNGTEQISAPLLDEQMQAYGRAVSYSVLNILRKPKY